MQPILFHAMSVSWTKLVVQHTIEPFMTPEPVSAKAARAPLDKLLPNPKARLKDQFHEAERFLFQFVSPLLTSGATAGIHG